MNNKKRYDVGEFYDFTKNFAIVQTKDFPIKVYFKDMKKKLKYLLLPKQDVITMVI